jgi:hypothetical protein
MTFPDKKSPFTPETPVQQPKMNREAPLIAMMESLSQTEAKPRTTLTAEISLNEHPS